MKKNYTALNNSMVTTFKNELNPQLGFDAQSVAITGTIHSKFTKTLLFFAVLFFSYFGASAQTTLISPSGAGGFELAVPTGTAATDYTANGWTLVQGANNRMWVGSVATPSAGTYSAFSGQSASLHTGEVFANINHFYRDVTFPAGETKITLAFKHKIVAPDTGGEYDNLKVFLVSTSITPVAGTAVSAVSIIGAAKYESATTYAAGTVSISIPAAAAGTTQRLVFSWKTDGAFPHAAISIDEIALTSAVPAPISGTRSIGPTGFFPSLTAAFAYLGANGVNGALNLELQATYVSTVETFPITATAISGSSFTNAITVSPASGANSRIITSTNTTATIDLNGASFITFDGRPGGTGNLAAINLTIENTSAATGGTAVRFSNDATNNTLQYNNLKASFASTTSGVVNILGGTTVTGNDNNTITLNNINGSGTALNGIYSAGNTTSSTTNNSGVVISNNNIYDFFGAGSATNGILVSTGTTDWTISGNRIFQTASRTYTSSNTHTGINISNSSGNNFIVTTNQIGGVSALTGGPTPLASYTLAGTIANRYRGISMAVGTTTASSVQGNIITNFTFASSSGATTIGGPWCGFYVSAGNVNIGNSIGNTIGSGTGTGSVTASISSSGGVSTGIFIDGGTTHVISNNAIGSITVLGSAAGISTGFTGIRVSSSSTATVSNNTLGSIATANSISANIGSTATTAGIVGGINNSSSATISITGNIIANFTNAYNPATTSNTLAFGILSTNGSNTITGNTIRNMGINAVATGTTSAASILGISLTSNTSPAVVSQNTIYSLSNTNSSASATVVAGIHYSGPTSGSNVVSRNYIYDLNVSATSATAAVNGINISGGTTVFSNNFIALGAGMANSPIISGINEPLGTNSIWHNNVYIGGSATSGTTASYAFNAQQTTNTRSFRNNVFVNNRGNSGATSKHYIIRCSTATGLTINNNVYFGNGSGNVFGFYNGADVADFTAWKLVTSQDAGSFNSDPLFVDATNALPNLHINPSLTTVVEGNGFDLGITDDFDGETRSGLTPVDIGADAGNFTGTDLTVPSITYTPLGSSIFGTNQTLTATITDAGSGVATTGIGRPVLYYKVNAGAYSPVTGVSIGGNQYTFTFGDATTAAGDVVSYYIVAQDLATTPNIGAFPVAGASGFSANPPAASTPPTTPSTFTAQNAISGIKTICSSGCDYTSLTNAGGAFASINASIVNGNLELQISENLSGELGTNALNQFPNPFTLKIYPTGAARTITGTLASNALMRLNGADRVTIDGSVGGLGIDKSLTITNSSTTSPSGIAFFSLGAGAGATDNTIKNCVVTTASNAATSYGILLGGDNNNNTTIQNNTVTKAYYGIYTLASATGLNANLSITENTVGTATVGSEISHSGIFVSFATGATISRNTISNILATASINPIGINISTGAVSSTVNANTISGVNASNTGGYGGRGIQINTGSTTSSLIVSNNAISDVKGSGWNAITSDAIMGIAIGNIASTGGVGVYFNSVNLGSGSFAGNSSGTLSAALAIGGVTNNLDIRNNVFATNLVNSGATSAKSYSIYSLAANTAFSIINYNDYFVSGTQGVLGNIASTDRSSLVNLVTGFGQNANSIAINPQFNSASNLQPLIGSPLLGAGVTGTGVTLSILGITRGNPPTIGAYELPVDSVGPIITYSTLANSCTPGARTLTATITDTSGVPTSGAGLPVLYWRIGAGAYSASTGVFVSGNTYTFSLGTGSTTGQTVSYYIVAQDNVGIGNTSVFPATGAAGFTSNPPAVSTPPTNPSSYLNLLTLSGDYTVGSAGAYPTITAAVAAYNTACISGAVTFSLTDATYTSETFPITINANATASAVNTLTIKPAASISPIISGANTTAILSFNGATFVTIDGSNNGSASKNLTISNTSTSGAAIQFINGASNNIIKNNLLLGVTTSSINGVLLMGASTAVDGNNNNTIQNNDITKGTTSPRACIVNTGTSGKPNTGNQYIGNRVMDFSSFGFQDGNSTNGFSNNTLFEGNSIFQNASQTSSLIGIYLANATGITNITLSKNKIFNLLTTVAGNVVGIDLFDLVSATVVNNTIALNVPTSTSLRGIAQESNGTSIKVYFNTVSISGTATDTSGSFAFLKNFTSLGDVVTNNIFSNTRLSSGIGKQYAIVNSSTGTMTSTFNNVFSNGNALNVLGLLGSTDYGTLAAWQGAGQGANSLSVAPNFVSETDLHLNVGTNLALDNFGTSIAEITTDIDGDIRSVSTPDMGADEFSTVFCGTANGGTAALAVSTLCESGTTTLSATGFSVGDGTLYEWEKSTDDFVTPVSMGAPSAIYAAISTGLVSETTEYRLKVICSAGAPAYSAPITLTVFAPTTITASATPNVICSGASISLAAEGAVSYTWSSTPAGYSATGANNTVLATVTTTYNVIGLDNNNCPTNTIQNVVTVNQTPSALTISPVASPICNGTLLTISTTGGTLTPVNQVVFSENFNSGIGTFSTVNTSSSSIQNWTARANSYSYDDGFGFYTFSGSISGFMLANSDAGGSGSTANTQLISPSINTNGYANLTLSFKEYLNNPTDTQAAIEISSDNFTTFTVLRNQLSSDIGSLTTFANTSFSIPSQFLNQSNVKIRFRYEGSYDYWWAIDELVVSSLVAPPANLTWSATSGNLFIDTINTPYTGQSVNTVYARPSENVTYTVTATSGDCSSTANTSVVVNQLPAFTAPSEVTICQGNGATLTATSLNGESNSFSWYLNSDLSTVIGSGASFSPTPNPITAAVYAVRAVSNTTSCTSNFSVVNLNVNNPGAITLNPIDATVATGGSTTFTVAGTISPSPVPYSYQWQRRTSVTPSEVWTNLTNNYIPTPASGNYSGVTTAVLTVRRAGLETALDNERFRCVLTPNYTPAASPACANLISNAAKLTVSTTGVTANPADITICLPAPTNPVPQFSITTNGQEPSSVDWEISTNGGSLFNPIALYTLNEDTEELEYAGPVTVSGLTFSHPLVGSAYDFKVILVDGITSTAANNFKFRAIVNTTITTTVATLNVSSPIAIAAMDDLSEAPTNVCKVSSTTTDLRIVPSGTVGTITWRYATSANGTYTNLAANTPLGVTYAVTNPAANDYRLAVTTSASTPVGSYFYKAFLNGVGVCPNLESKVATIIVNQPVVAIAAPITAYCTPGPAVTLTASGATSYSWTATPAGFTASGAIQNVTPTANTTYIVEGTDEFGCKATAQQVITVGSAITVTTANITALSCPGTALALTSTVNNPSAADQYLITTGSNSRNYAVTAVNGSFTPLVGATSSSLTLTEDDAMSATITPGMTFNYGGTNYTNFRVSSNGHLVFGAAGTSTATNNLATTTATLRGLAPLWDDLVCTQGVTYKVDGIAPNRVLTVEWLNMVWAYSFGFTSPVISFQAKLYETTNVIEYVYRQEATDYNGLGSTGGASIGLMGTAGTNFISLENSTASPTISTTVSTNNIITKPATGQVYRFTPSIAPVYTYSWTSTPGTFTSAAANPSVSPTVATTYNLTVTTPNGCNAAAVPLAVNMFNTAPTITTQPVASAICAGQPASFSVAATNAVAMTYQWRRNGSNLTNGSGVSGATTNSLSLTTAAALAGNYDVLVSSCTNLTTTSDAVALTINTLPTVAVSPSTATFCAPDGDAVVLTASGADTYTWLPITDLSSAMGAVVNASPTATRVYTVTGTAANGCTNTASTSIAILQKPQAVTANASMAAICVGGSSNLTASSTTIPSGVSNYSFAATSGVYQTITAGTALATATWDDTGVGIAIPLGFSFNYNGASYTTCNINLNGYISFGTTTTTSNYTPISTLVTNEVATIAAFGRDLQGLATIGEVRYLSTGGEFIVQWSNARRYSSSANTESINFQIRLNQATGQIRFVYGAFTNAGANTSTALPQVGLRGISTADFKNIEVLSTGNWSSPAAGTLNTSTAYYNQAAVATKPTTGLTYTFTPPSLNYAWSGLNGFTAATQNTSISSATLAASGVYTVTATNGVCSTTAQTTVTVTTPPNAGIINGTQAICSNGTTQFSTTGTGGTWSSDALEVATVNAITGLVSGVSGGNATISYTAIGTGGCTNTVATRTVNVTNSQTWYADLDNDGFGNPVVTQQSCTQPSGYVANNTDCNDAIFAINPAATEICWNNIDDNCNNIKSEGCTAIPVYVNNPAPISGLGVGTISNFATHLSAIPYTYPGATSLDYRFEVTNISVTPNQTRTFTQTGTFARYFTIPVDIRGFNTTYAIRASAVINGEEVPYVVPVIMVRSTSIPSVTLSPTSCGASLSSLNTTISANPGFNASSYEFRIRLTSDNGATPVYYYVQSSSRFIGANSFIGLSLQYSTSYSVSVRYATLSVGDGATAVISGYGEECIITTPSIPLISLSSPVCGSRIDRFGATISASPATYAQQYQFRVRLTSDNGPTTTYYTTLPSASRYSSLMAVQGLVLTNDTQYSVSVRYSIPVASGGTVFSSYGSECIVITPIAAVARIQTTPFSVAGYPNPFAEGFQLNVKTTSASNVSISVYDMIGRLIETRSSKASTVETITIGERYPSGVYNVIVTQDDQVATVRMIKR